MALKGLQSRYLRVLIAGGGTGGHLYPAMALAERIHLNWEHSRIEFVGSHRGVEVKEVPRHGYTLHKLDIGGIVGKNLETSLLNLFRILMAVRLAARILRGYDPDIVIGVGGYASVPALLAAWLLRVPRVLLEQNAVPGRANRLLARLAHRVYASFDSSVPYFPARRVRRVGNPVRLNVLEDDGARPDPKAFTILQFGGSLGSRGLNTIMAEAYADMKKAIPNLKLIHQTGQAEYFRTRDLYKAAGVLEEVELHSFIEDMGRFYRRCDVAFCRSGATTIAELASTRTPAVLVPLPRSAGDHQKKNAESLTGIGAALLIEEKDLDHSRLVEVFSGLATDPKKLADMRARLESMPHPDAAKAILEDIQDLLPEERRRDRIE